MVLLFTASYMYDSFAALSVFMFNPMKKIYFVQSLYK